MALAARPEGSGISLVRAMMSTTAATQFANEGNA
jgi:hypothetical protein